MDPYINFGWQQKKALSSNCKPVYMRVIYYILLVLSHVFGGRDIYFTVN